MQYGEADKLYRKLLEATPDDPDVLASYGLSQIGQHKFDEAAKTFQAMQKLPELPDNLQVLAKTQLAFIDLQMGNYAAAIDEAMGQVAYELLEPLLGEADDARLRARRYLLGLLDPDDEVGA